MRIFDPSRHGATPTSFRFVGPLRRFDHHHPGGSSAGRGVYYASFTLSGCLVEVFGDTRVVEFAEKRVARSLLNRDLRLLDLRENGAMRAGTVAAIAKTAEYALSQEWSRYFYEHAALYSLVDGLWYRNAHNDEEAVALYERCSDALVCRSEDVRRLDDAELRPAVLDIALETGMIV